MLDLFLIFFFVAVIVGGVIINVRILLYYQQPEDGKFSQSVFCKVIIVLSMTLAWFVNVLLPVDVRNSRPVPGILDMEILWTAGFIGLATCLVIVVPAAMFYVEVEGDDVVKKKKKHVLCYLSLTIFFGMSIVAISYPFLSHASIPIVEYACEEWQDANTVLAPNTCGTGRQSVLEIRIAFQIYIIAVLCFIGWFFFVTFGGIGLSAVPLDLILEFVDRPQSIDEHTYQQRRRLLGSASARLMTMAENLQARDGELSVEKGWGSQRKKRALRSEYNKFRRDVFLIEEQYEKLKVCKFHKGENCAVSITKLVIGILCAILSITWVLHILLYVVAAHITPDGKPASTFLNDLFGACEGSGLYPVGVSFFAVFSLYLLLCVVKGCLKFGMRIFFLFAIHPMRQQATPLNSILFNVEMMLISSAATVQFTQQAFADYARLTSADVIFAAQIKYMSFYSWFFKNNVFVYALLGWFLLALIYLLVKPRDNKEFSFDAKADKKIGSLAGKSEKKSDTA